MAQPVHDDIRSTGSGPQAQAQSQPDYDEPNRSSKGTEPGGAKSRVFTKQQRLSAKLANPLAGKTHAELEDMGARYAKQHQLGEEDDIRAFQKGACLAQDPEKFSDVTGLTAQELDILGKEFTNRWSQPKLLYLVIVLCSTCAAVQGMGEEGPSLRSRDQ